MYNLINNNQIKSLIQNYINYNEFELAVKYNFKNTTTLNFFEFPKPNFLYSSCSILSILSILSIFGCLKALVLLGKPERKVTKPERKVTKPERKVTKPEKTML
jgi:hypothetical protein